MVDEEEIGVEVVVPVDPGHAGAHRLGEIHVAIGPIDLGPVDASFSRNVFKRRDWRCDFTLHHLADFGDRGLDRCIGDGLRRRGLDPPNAQGQEASKNNQPY